MCTMMKRVSKNFVACVMHMGSKCVSFAQQLELEKKLLSRIFGAIKACQSVEKRRFFN